MRPPAASRCWHDNSQLRGPRFCGPEVPAAGAGFVGLPRPSSGCRPGGLLTRLWGESSQVCSGRRHNTGLCRTEVPLLCGCRLGATRPLEASLWSSLVVPASRCLKSSAFLFRLISLTPFGETSLLVSVVVIETHVDSPGESPDPKVDNPNPACRDPATTYCNVLTGPGIRARPPVGALCGLPQWRRSTPTLWPCSLPTATEAQSRSGPSGRWYKIQLPIMSTRGFVGQALFRTG